MGGYTYTAKFDNGKVDMTSDYLLNSSSGDKWSAEGSDFVLPGYLRTKCTSYIRYLQFVVPFLSNQEGPVMLTDMPATMSLCLWK